MKNYSRKRRLTRLNRNRRNNAKGITKSIPMKCRSLPQSFWQQPNKILNTTKTNSQENILKADIKSNVKNDEIISDANTDLLFSLFKSIEDEQMFEDENNANNNDNMRKRKRTKCLTKVLKDDDPYLANNNIRENLLLLLLPVKDKMKNSQRQQEQVHRLKSATSIFSGTTSAMKCGFNECHDNYSQILSQLVVQL